jgi:SAM-dependent methyltransferase
LDAGTREFATHAFEHPRSAIGGALHATLRRLLSDFDVNALLGTHPVYLLSAAQWAHLLGDRRERLLDVGAGNGNVTAELSASCARVFTTENSRFMCRALRARGFHCERVPIDDPLPDDRPALQGTFDVVACLNVVDRTSHPWRLLTAACQRVAAGGLLIIAVPLPLDPFYYRGGRVLTPEQRLPPLSGAWEEQCSGWTEALSAHLPELQLRSVSRAPYLSAGTRRQRLAVLDDAVLVFERVRRSGQDAKYDLR